MFKVNNKDGVFIVNFEQISHLFLLLTLNRLVLAELAIIKKVLMIEISWIQREYKTGRTMHIFIVIMML